MNIPYKNYLTVALMYLVGLFGFIMTLVALNISRNSGKVYIVYKWMEDKTTMVKSTAYMAYFGSIITLTIAVLLIFAAMFFTFKFYASSGKFALNNYVIAILWVIILGTVALSIASLVTSMQILNWTWITNHNHWN